ncbi:uncharacterized protein B0H18DRAFT_53391 [Fomitopsis serialis]|uniref:uncharacterized protein n=1 Tax=Fomitopsis serialis TaxID=139415 RepID=UPI0020081EA1|nr:uncharacterized protein B0H18DRAFT_53391 [Neoantrodia serialis]KAH9932323.1 hypothetical protein B0H18DRAFT_53391 [Neoantrodia serialis]
MKTLSKLWFTTRSSAALARGALALCARGRRVAHAPALLTVVAVSHPELAESRASTVIARWDIRPVRSQWTCVSSPRLCAR